MLSTADSGSKQLFTSIMSNYYRCAITFVMIRTMLLNLAQLMYVLSLSRIFLLQMLRTA